MSSIMRIVLCLSVMVLLLCLPAGCGKAEKEAQESGIEQRAQESEKGAAKADENAPSEVPASSSAALRLAAITKDVTTVGELPDGFPTDLVPLYPGGEIDRAALKKGEATVLQTSSDPGPKVLKFYHDFYTGRGWEEGNFVKVGGKDFGGFKGPDGVIHMTLHTQSNGKTFFSLVLATE